MNKPTARHPIQPLEMVNEVLRFKQNKIVRDLLDFQTLHHMKRLGHQEERVAELLELRGEEGLDLNRIAVLHAQGVYSDEDLDQLGQLIGYSHSGAPSYVSGESLEASIRQYEDGTSELQARYDALLDYCTDILEPLREAATAAFSTHPDDLVSRLITPPSETS